MAKRAARYIGDDQRSWVAGLADRNDLPLLRADDLADEILADAAGVAVHTVAERRSTFGRANILAEVHRQLQGVRFASPDDRIAVAERTADLALAQSLLLSPPELHHTPEHLRRADGTTRFRAKGHCSTPPPRSSTPRPACSRPGARWAVRPPRGARWPR